MTLSVFTKPNESAQEIYERFSGLLLWAKEGAALIDPPWHEAAPKSWRRFLSRNFFGRYLSDSINLKTYEADLHNMQTPLIYQTLLNAVRNCSTNKAKPMIKECFQKNLDAYKGPFYGHSVAWDEEHNFLWLPVPDSLSKEFGYTTIYLNVQ
jgi:hypothetical protein